VNSARRLRRGFGLATVVVLVVAGPAIATTPTNPGPPAGHSKPNGDLDASAGGVSITYPTGKPKGASSAPLASNDVSWTPPPCWVGPVADPKTFKANLLKSVKDTWVPGQANYALEAMDELQRHYEEGYTWEGGGKGYKNFNLDQEGKGMFWGPVVNPDSDSVHRFDCNGTLAFWVPNGQQPPPGTPNVITPEMLSKLAYAHTHVPGVRVETNPVGTQTVNLPTWVTLEKAYTPVKVRASVDLGGGREIWAETTAEPAGVHIDAGTADATLFPGSGNCPIGPDGKVGAAYNGDPKADPPCGVTYLHSTDGAAPYQLNATVNWKVSWTGSDGGPHPLPDGRVDAPHPVTVREIQTINN
jgi:hypothetical protein